jgi:hypothetical protein
MHSRCISRRVDIELKEPFQVNTAVASAWIISGIVVEDGSSLSPWLAAGGVFLPIAMSTIESRPQKYYEPRCYCDAMIREEPTKPPVMPPTKPLCEVNICAGYVLVARNLSVAPLCLHGREGDPFFALSSNTCNEHLACPRTFTNV